MININLLPHEFRPIKRTPLPYIASGAVFALALAVIGVVSLKNMSDISGASRRLADHKQALTQLQPVVEEYNAISTKKLKLAEQVDTINEIVSDRILWSRQLYNLNRLAADNMWYDGIEVSHKQVSEKREVYDPKVKQMKSVTDMVDHRVLTLSGYVIAGKDGNASINPFTLAAEGDDEFSHLFQLDQSSFKDTQFEKVGVRSFKLEYLILAGEKSL
jgi:hypothetical protein